MVQPDIPDTGDQHGDVPRRGRKPNHLDPAAGPVAEFAHLLCTLRMRAGNPSFADMSSKLKAAASKSSLAAAAQGRVLPSWETTWEFVRVLAVDRLGQDAAETERWWRQRWAGVRAAGLPEPPAKVPDARHRPLRVMAAEVLVVAALCTGVVWVGLSEIARPASTTPPGRDDSRFEADVTYPDGSTVPLGERFIKVWRLRNTGTVRWEGRSLLTINLTRCHTPSTVPVPSTEPGQSVEVRVPVRAPARTARCRIGWKMIDKDHRIVFPYKRPIFLDVLVR